MLRLILDILEAIISSSSLLVSASSSSSTWRWRALILLVHSVRPTESDLGISYVLRRAAASMGKNEEWLSGGRCRTDVRFPTHPEQSKLVRRTILTPPGLCGPTTLHTVPPAFTVPFSPLRSATAANTPRLSPLHRPVPRDTLMMRELYVPAVA